MALFHSGQRAVTNLVLFMRITCPICKQESDFSQQNLARPFCSKRCQEIDLGIWAQEKYTITDDLGLSKQQKNGYNTNNGCDENQG